MRSIYISATGMDAQQINMDVIANNLANVNTAGFKRSRADFQDLLYQTLRPAGVAMAQGTESPTGIQVGYGSKPSAVQKLFTPGDFNPTRQDLDIAIEGDGFFQVQMPDGTTQYTRAGSLKKDSQGRIVTSEGNPILPQITIPSDAIELVIGTDGTVSVLQQGQQSTTVVGQMQLAQFLNPAGLSAAGHNLYKQTDAAGQPTVGTPGQTGFGTLSQGYLEMSNVAMVDELVGMIIGQRAYEINSKVIKTVDQMLSVAVSLRS